MSDSGTMKILKNRNNFSNIENSHFLSKELVARPDKACEITTMAIFKHIVEVFSVLVTFSQLYYSRVVNFPQ